MNSREKILNAVKGNLPKESALPDLNFTTTIENVLEKFTAVLTGIGGKVITVNSWEDINAYINTNFESKRTIRYPGSNPNELLSEQDPHLLEDVNLAILRGHFGVAENGALWITGEMMGDRALPFISENLALVINKKDILPTLHDAYKHIALNNYEFGTFIAGPSKTADIEQSLVLGAHGPKTLLVFILSN